MARSSGFSAAAAAVVLIAAVATATAQEKSTEELAKAAQNPIADMISLPFQSNTNFLTGPYRRTQEIMNIQPVIPFHLTDDWNVITRTIMPIVGQVPTLTSSSAVGLGDINPAFYFSPSHPGELIWGVGPVFTLPTATERTLGSGKWSAGPGFVALTIQGHWVVGVVANNQWSVAGDWNRTRVSQLTAQPFINYNFPEGWYLTSGPIVTANWVARPSQQWTVPLGGGFGRVFKIEKQPINASLQGYYNVVRPNDAARWQLRAQLTFLFPK